MIDTIAQTLVRALWAACLLYVLYCLAVVAWDEWRASKRREEDHV